MPIPPTVTRTTKDGVEFISNVDRCSYTIKELTRAALRDVGNFILITANKKAQKLYYNSMMKSKRVRGKTSIFEKWVRTRECDLHVGMGNIKKGKTGDTWYGIEQELGSSKMKKHGILTSSVQDNIATIIKIESQYLSALEDEAEALALISEEEYEGGADD